MFSPPDAPRLPSLSVSPSGEIGEGSSVNLTCSSDANPAPSYTWYKKNQNKPVSEGPQLIFSSIQSSDSGEYVCKAVNHLGTKTSTTSISLDVKYAPKLTSASVSPSGEIVQGTLVTLTCSSDANPAANYTWYKKNQENPVSKGPQLIFRSIWPSKSGEYHCKAENHLGTKTSTTPISIDVKYAPKVISVSVSPSGEIVEGSSVNLTCRSDANPAASYTWYKKNQNKPVSQGPQLIFSSIQSSNSGEYVCKAVNRLGTRTSTTSISIDVKYAPKLPSVSVSPSKIVEGSSVTLTCRSDANPAANYTWYKKNQNKPLSEGPQLIFSSIQSSNSGEYVCEAVNRLGRKKSRFISLDVKYAPKLPSMSVSPSGEIVEGSSVNLTCSSDANPAASYTWYKEDEPLLQGPEGVLRFTSISSEDRGSYYCMSENLHGSIDSTPLFVNVQYAPKLISVSVSPSEIVEGSSVNLTCSSDANPAANYTWYKEHEHSPKASGDIFTIIHFGNEHSGNYYCEAQNTIGRSNSTLYLITLSDSLTEIIFWSVVGSVIFLFLALIFLDAFLLIRRRRSSDQTRQPAERPDNNTQINASVNFSENQENHLYCMMGPALPQRPNEEAEVVHTCQL